MKCKVCGAESGKYPLCRACNSKKDAGQIIKCENCGNWHYVNAPCITTNISADNQQYLYEIKQTLISKSEQAFYSVIKSSLPEGYCVFPQINLATFIERTDDARYHNELFRNVDFLITDADYSPKFIIEINDQTHLNTERKERDEKVQNICEEAGIPILKLWTSYGINPEYIKGRIDDLLGKLPVARVHHFNQETPPVQSTPQPQPVRPQPTAKKSGGCYVATCVYGSYDCPEVWALRRFRDNTLAKNLFGKIFIKIYYTVSPTLVKWFGRQNWFVSACKYLLDNFVTQLYNNGVENTPYDDN